MYNPFANAKGNPLDIKDIHFRHLSVLKDIDEGYSIEYKANFSDTVKNKIASIITSFANSDGGWLILGIEDKSHELISFQKPRTDISQTISQLLKSYTSPLPIFESKYVSNPKAKNEGVVIVKVPAGRFPPYVANGTIYVRNGSSKEPIKSDRATIDLLYKKADKFLGEILEFAKRTIHLPVDGQSVFFKSLGKSIPVICLYFKYIGSSNKKMHSINDLQHVAKHMKNDDILKYSRYTDSSVVLQHAIVNPKSGITYMCELFLDYSVKYLIPIKEYSQDEREAIANMIPTQKEIFLDANTYIAEGMTTINFVLKSLMSFHELAINEGLNIADYALVCGYENLSGVVSYFDGDQFMTYTGHEGLCYCISNSPQSEVIYLRHSYIHRQNDWPWEIIIEYILPMLGIESLSGYDIFMEAFKMNFIENKQ